MSTAKLLSLCCGALPYYGIINERFGHSTGTCSLCGDHTTFAPGGVLEAQPRFLTLPPLHPVQDGWIKHDYHLADGASQASTTPIEQASWWHDFCLALRQVSWWACLWLLMIWMASRAQGCFSSVQSSKEQGVSGGHSQGGR